MSSIDELDVNFQVNDEVVREGQKFYSCEEAPFSLHGVYREGDHFVRLPSAVASTVNPGVSCHCHLTAGGRVRFVTDSPYVAIYAKVGPHYKGYHFTIYASSGFDAYVKRDDVGQLYHGTFRTSDAEGEVYQSILTFPEGEREITINFPLYRRVYELYIGLDENATLKPPAPYKYEKPVLFYGSSITQGGCACRAGMSYEGILSRRLDFDFINLGFSGSARGEREISDYLASLDPSVFVLDYDHNAKTPEMLEETHEPLFKNFRAKHPKTPVIMISKPLPEIYFTEADHRRRSIIRRTYENACAAGDENVYFIDGSTMLCTEALVDRCHPTDLGFMMMSDAIEPVLRDALEKAERE